MLEYHEIIECIMAALDAKIPYTAGHSKRVSDMTEIPLGLRIIALCDSIDTMT